MVAAMVLLNLAGGDAVEDLEILEKDAGGVAEDRVSWLAASGATGFGRARA
jgi:hypothetical protein